MNTTQLSTWNSANFIL